MAAGCQEIVRGCTISKKISALNIENHYKKQAKLSHGLNTD